MDAANGQSFVVVTGASAGIGRACARVFAARGDRVALLAARAVLYAAEHPRRREYWVGGSTSDPGRQRRGARAVGPLSGAHGVPGPADGGTPQPGPAREPVGSGRRRPGHDFGAHGIFDDRSTSRSPQLWASQLYGILGLGSLAGAVLGPVLSRRRTR